ncbi:MAG: DNA primase [Candidatus Yanofskybacteria bacterium RIFCSPLOWO2_12_FULL_41_8]|nr:MAG: DNA primase [Candidatus Yanofskybacteria bacterium RIFCSPLOWO2_12_FULL_41_8]
MEDNISKIKDRLSVVDVISGYIKVQKSGINFKARCPFHNEKTPSFYISPERQIWHCFGCQKGGDIFGFVKEIEAVEFPEALRILAQRAGVKLQSFDPSTRDAKAVLYDICETATRFFEKQLHGSSVGKKVAAYLKNRGLEEDMIKEFRLGLAPDSWHYLGNFLRDCGFSDEDIISAGVSLRRENGSDMYDRFRSRIIFPIADANGQMVGFTGRIFEEGINVDPFPGHQKALDPGAKYINTPQTLIYDKSRVLYGLNKAKSEARRADRCLLVEGNMDVIMSYQAGVRNVAGTSGTALTPSHLQLLQRYTSNLDFCFDADQAGLVATRRGIGLALSQNFNVKIVSLQDPECKDPADYVKKFGNKWQEIVQIAKPVIDFYFDKLKSDVDITSVEGKKSIIVVLGPLIKRLASRVEKSHWITKLAVALKTKEDAIEEDINLVKDDLATYELHGPHVPDQQIAKIEKQKNMPEDMLSQAILAVIFRNPAVLKNKIMSLDVNGLDLLASKALSKLKESDLDDFNFGKFVKEFDSDTAMRLEFAHLKSEELLKDFNDEELKEELMRLINVLERKSVSAKLANLELDIKKAELDKDDKKLVPLLTKFANLTRKLSR